MCIFPPGKTVQCNTVPHFLRGFSHCLGLMEPPIPSWPDCRPVPWAKHTDSLTSKGEANSCLQQQFPFFKGQGKERSYLLVLFCLPCSAEGLSRSRSTFNLTIVSKADGEKLQEECSKLTQILKWNWCSIKFMVIQGRHPKIWTITFVALAATWKVSKYTR